MAFDLVFNERGVLQRSDVCGMIFCFIVSFCFVVSFSFVMSFSFVVGWMEECFDLSDVGEEFIEILDDPLFVFGSDSGLVDFLESVQGVVGGAVLLVVDFLIKTGGVFFEDGSNGEFQFADDIFQRQQFLCYFLYLSFLFFYLQQSLHLRLFCCCVCLLQVGQ